MDRKSFGKRMQKYRELLGYSQESLAEMIDSSTIFISFMERGEKSPSLDNLIKLANALEISTDLLLGRALSSYNTARLSHIEKHLKLLPPEEQEKILNIMEYMISLEICRQE